MIETIAEWGDFAITRKLINPEDLLITGDTFKKTSHVLAILLEKLENGGFQYKRVSVEIYDDNKKDKYLYRKKSSAGAEFTPTAFLTKPEKTFNNKILRWYKDSTDPHMESVYQELESKRNKIIKDLTERYNSLKIRKGNNVLVTIKFLDGSSEKYLGEINEYIEILRKDSAQRYYYMKSLGKALGKTNCFLCGEFGEVYGFTLPAVGFLFATADKPSFTPNLRRDLQWKNIPLCGNCSDKVEAGKRFIDKYLSFKFFRIKYYVLPKVLKEETREFIYNKIIAHYTGKQYEQGILSEEDYMSDEVKKLEDILSLSFLFYETVQARFLIRGFAEQIYPSRLQQLYKAKEDVEKVDILHEQAMKRIFGKKWVGNFLNRYKSNWPFQFLNYFFPNSEEFIRLTVCLLMGKAIGVNLYKCFMDKIRGMLHNDFNDFTNGVIMSFALLLFLRNLYNPQPNPNKPVATHTDLEERMEEFFQQNELSQPYKKASFTSGVLVACVLSVQREEREVKEGEEPFWRKLHGLKINERILKKVFVESVNKLSEYKRSCSKLEELVARYLINAEGKFTGSVDEMSYYFTLGLVLGPSFISMQTEKADGSTG
ncbi:MAG: TM1802 family CRISPR-associated protein [Nitrososphaerota archaeon]